MKAIAREFVVGLFTVLIMVVSIVLGASMICRWLFKLPLRIWDEARAQCRG